MFEWITQNLDAVVQIVTTIGAFSAIAIPKLIGDKKTRNLLGATSKGVDVVDNAINQMNGVLRKVDVALSQLQAQTDLSSEQMIEQQALKLELAQIRLENKALLDELKQQREIANLKAKKEM